MSHKVEFVGNWTVMLAVVTALDSTAGLGTEELFSIVNGLAIVLCLFGLSVLCGYR